MFDANFLSMYLLAETGPLPIDPSTGKPTESARARIQHLVSELEAENAIILIPTPVLSEFLVFAGDKSNRFIEKLTKMSVFKIVDFNTSSAIVAADIQRQSHREGNKKGGSQSSWTKIKFDRMILAMALAWEVECIYSSDKDMKSFGENIGVSVIAVHELELPSSQPSLFHTNLEMKEPSSSF